jgi:hypothetical protein
MPTEKMVLVEIRKDYYVPKGLTITAWFSPTYFSASATDEQLADALLDANVKSLCFGQRLQVRTLIPKKGGLKKAAFKAAKLLRNSSME